MRARTGSVLAAMTMAAGGLVAVAGPTDAAAPTIGPAATSVAVGSNLTATPTECDAVETETPDGFTFRSAEVVLITGTGGDARLATIGVQREDGEGRELLFSVPGWVDPAQPTVLAGRCIEQTYGRSGASSRAVLFNYPDVAVDVTPGPPSTPGPVFTLDRATASGGQVLTVTGRGCAQDQFVQAALFSGGDLSGRDLGEPVAYAGIEDDAPRADGTFAFDLTLNGQAEYDDDGSQAGGPVDEGDYKILLACTDFDQDLLFAAPQAVQVVGTNPSGTIRLASAQSGSYTISGEGCTGGRVVALETTISADDDPFAEGLRRRHRALEQGSTPAVLTAGRSVRNHDASADAQTETVTPGADGTWSSTVTVPEGGFFLRVVADCGDPHTDGFRYVEQDRFESNTADVYLDRTSPTSSPVGAPVTVHGNAYCDRGEAPSVAFYDRQGNPLDASVPVAVNGYLAFSATLTAPGEPGEYFLAGRCGDKRGYPSEYQVFTPATLAPRGPLPAEPTSGWPSTGERETYHGRIGPISLPAMDQEMDGLDGSVRAMGPSGLFIQVPRPEGDFAITGLRFDLVDGSGMPVGHQDAHLHHFVISNTSKQNPACPGSTFGLPGQIVGAAGAERTALSMEDPYGLVVKGSDKWTGVYDVMSRAEHPQEVYLSYDMDIRRDVENVRPVTTYFGSATGCGTFTWTIDGLGTPDVQSTYITIAHDGVLLGTGGHIHNGGLYTDLTDDRGRRLCRSELVTGEGSGHGGHSEADGHGGMADGSMAGTDTAAGGAAPATTAPATTATTTLGDGADGDGGDYYPPEFYDDDPPIEAITNCRLREAVKEGERLRFDAVYRNERPRSGVMGIYESLVWEGGGPEAPTRVVDPPSPPGPPDPNDPGLPADPGPPADPGSPGDPGPPGTDGQTGAPGAPGAPGGSAPGGSAPGGSAPGGSAPGGSAPGGSGGATDAVTPGEAGGGGAGGDGGAADPKVTEGPVVPTSAGAVAVRADANYTG